MGQWESAVIIHKHMAKTENGERYEEVRIDSALPVDQTRFLTITSGENGTAIYLEGKLVDIFPDTRLIGENESLMGRSIRVGNSSDAKSPWFGRLYGLAIYDHSLTPDQVLQGYHGWTRQVHLKPYFEDRAIARYAFVERSGAVARSIVGANDSLIIPQHLPFEKRVLEPPEKAELLSFWLSKDIVVNIIGFIPFGFLVAAWLKMARRWDLGRSYAIVIGLGFLISLSIELLQVYMPVRSSSRVDLFCNTLGAVLGASLFHALVLNRQRRGDLSVRV